MNIIDHIKHFIKPSVDTVISDFTKMENRLHDMVERLSDEMDIHHRIVEVQQEAIRLKDAECAKAEAVIEKIQSFFKP